MTATSDVRFGADGTTKVQFTSPRLYVAELSRS